MRIRLAVMIVLTALVATACGDDDSGATTAPTTGNTTGSTTGTGVTFGGGPLTSEQCLQVVLTWSQAMSLGLVGTAGDIETSVEALETLATQVPAEVADDFVILAQAVGQYSAALQAAGINLADPASYSSAEAQAALVAAQDTLDASGINEASDNVSDYLDANCGDG